MSLNQHIRNTTKMTPQEIDQYLDEINDKIDGFGVEAIRNPDQWVAYYLDIAALFINRGDTYETTIIYDVEEDRLTVESWGDFVERKGWID